MLTQEQLLAMSDDAYMNQEQRDYFRGLLLEMKNDIRLQVEQARSELAKMEYEADELDKAAQEEDRRLQLRFLDRQTKLLPKLDASLKRLDTDEFGYCQVTGEPIGIPRLLARPTATLCAEEKMRQEQQERNYRDH